MPSYLSKYDSNGAVNGLKIFEAFVPITLTELDGSAGLIVRTGPPLLIKPDGSLISSSAPLPIPFIPLTCGSMNVVVPDPDARSPIKYCEYSDGLSVIGLIPEVTVIEFL